MQCLFCKKDSSRSKAVEHIIPESLGNCEHLLPKGTVCDKCNNYFAIKIEKPLLEMPYFKNMRHRNIIRNKKGRLVEDKALIAHPNGGWVDLMIDEKGFIFRNEDKAVTALLANGTVNKMYFPIEPDPKPNNPIISRFLAKVALEALSARFIVNEDWIEELINHEGLDDIRNYARYGKGNFWPYKQRRIYTEDDRFCDPIFHPSPYEVLHEMDFLYLDEQILYFTLVIMGIEYTINLGGPEVELFEQWLERNNGQSPIKRGSEYMIIRKGP